MAKMPRVAYVPGTKEGVINVQLTKPTTINTGNPSAFPMAADVFKNLNYQTAQQSELNTQMKEYYEILARIMGGNTKPGDMQQLENITGQIREFVLTDDDYNLVIGALQNMQAYIISFMYGDITRKAQAMDVELNKVLPFEKALLAFAHSKYDSLLKDIDAKPDYSDEVVAKLTEVVKDFKSTQTY